MFKLWVIVCLVCGLMVGEAAAIDFTVTLRVHNLKGSILEVGVADDDPAKPLRAADVVLTGDAFVGRDSVDNLTGRIPISMRPNSANPNQAIYSIQLTAPNDSQVVRVIVSLPGRQTVDLGRLAAKTQNVDVSMPEKKNVCCYPCYPQCRRQVWFRCRR